MHVAVYQLVCLANLRSCEKYFTEVVHRNMLIFTCVPVLITTEITIATMASQRISVTGTEIPRLHDDRKKTP